MNKLSKCIKLENIQYSDARESIYKIFIEAKICLSVNDIMIALSKTHTTKISLNTLYRHLTLFVKCNLIITIQDNLKKSYYYLVSDRANAFLLCPKCNDISHFNDSDINKVLLYLDGSDFITIHRRCTECQG